MQIESISDIEYVNRDGVGLHLDIHRPANVSQPLPVVIGIPGGGWRNCAKEGFPLFLVEQGFAIVAINYRVSSVATAPANILDCKAAVRWVRANSERYGFDPARVGAYGASAGGHLTALLGASSGTTTLEEESVDSSVKAVCAVCGPMDLTRIGRPEIRKDFPVLYEVTEKYLGGPVLDRIALAQTVSPLTYVSAACPPMLLLHGTADQCVPVEETLVFHEALTKASVSSTLRLVEGVGHDMLVNQTADDVTAFFKCHLG